MQADHARTSRSAAILGYLEEIVAAGAFLEGAADQALDELRVVAE